MNVRVEGAALSRSHTSTFYQTWKMWSKCASVVPFVSIPQQEAQLSVPVTSAKEEPGGQSTIRRMRKFLPSVRALRSQFESKTNVESKAEINRKWRSSNNFLDPATHSEPSRSRSSSMGSLDGISCSLTMTSSPPASIDNGGGKLVRAMSTISIIQPTVASNVPEVDYDTYKKRHSTAQWNPVICRNLTTSPLYAHRRKKQKTKMYFYQPQLSLNQHFPSKNQQQKNVTDSFPSKSTQPFSIQDISKQQKIKSTSNWHQLINTPLTHTKLNQFQSTYLFSFPKCNAIVNGGSGRHHCWKSCTKSTRTSWSATVRARRASAST